MSSAMVPIPKDCPGAAVVQCRFQMIWNSVFQTVFHKTVAANICCMTVKWMLEYLASSIRNVKKENVKDIYTDDTVRHKFVAEHGKPMRPPVPACRVCIRHPIPSPCSLALATHNSSPLCLCLLLLAALHSVVFFFLIWSLMRCVSDINHESKKCIIPCSKEFVYRVIFHCRLSFMRALPSLVFVWVMIMFRVSYDQTSLKTAGPGEELGHSLCSGPRGFKTMFLARWKLEHM